MEKFKVNESDLTLINQAKKLIGIRKLDDWHAVSSVMRTQSGRVFEGLHLEAYVGRIAICAEAVALGAAAVAGDTNIDTIVAVYKDREIVSPCGMCREMISDYSPKAFVILQDEDGPFKVQISDLIPLKYSRD